MSKKQHQIAEAFGALLPELDVPSLPASSPVLNKTAEPQATMASINMRPSLTIRSQDEETEDCTGTATFSPSASSSTSATFVSTLGDDESQSDLIYGHHHHNVGNGVGQEE